MHRTDMKRHPAGCRFRCMHVFPALSAIAVEIQTTTDSVADPVYVRVASPVTADIADYFEMDEYGRYIETTDAAVVAGKTYYEVDEG